MNFFGCIASLSILLGASLSNAAMSLNFPFTASSGKKIATLADLNTYLKSNYAGGDVSIYILPGTYSGSASWNFRATSGTLKISGKDATNLPVFDGCLNGCISGESNGYFFRLQDGSKITSNVVIQKIKVKNYTNGIMMANAQNITVSNVVFENIGTAFNDVIPLKDGEPAYGGYSALMSDNSSNIKITNNTFINSYNKENPLWFHAVYLKSTVNSYVQNNVMDMISGDPIRVRDECNNVRISNNIISNSGMAPVTTFEQVGEECPSFGIKSVSNTFGMMFPYKKIFSQVGFVVGWANKSYLHEGMQMGQGYKVTVDPALSPSSCLYRKVVNKWQVFTSSLNSFVLPSIDPRNLEKSVAVIVTGTGDKPYVTMAKSSELVMDSNMFFVGCNSDSSSTCQNNGTTSIADDKDPFNEDSSKEIYKVSLKLKMGSVAQKIEFTGGQYKSYALTIQPPASYDASGFAVVQLPISMSVADRSQAILKIKTLNSGLKIQSVLLSEAN